MIEDECHYLQHGTYQSHFMKDGTVGEADLQTT